MTEPDDDPTELDDPSLDDEWIDYGCPVGRDIIELAAGAVK